MKSNTKLGRIKLENREFEYIVSSQSIPGIPHEHALELEEVQTWHRTVPGGIETMNKRVPAGVACIPRPRFTEKYLRDLAWVMAQHYIEEMREFECQT